MRIQRQQESDEQQWKEIDFIKLIQLLSFVAMLTLLHDQRKWEKSKKFIANNEIWKFCLKFQSTWKNLCCQMKLKMFLMFPRIVESQQTSELLRRNRFMVGDFRYFC